MCSGFSGVLSKALPLSRAMNNTYIIHIHHVICVVGPDIMNFVQQMKASFCKELTNDQRKEVCLVTRGHVSTCGLGHR